MSGIILPGQEKPNPARRINPIEEVSKILRMIEEARHEGLEHICALLMRLANMHYKVIIDPSVQDGRVTLSAVTHYTRDLAKGIKIQNDQVIRLGKFFAPAYELAVTRLNPKPEEEKTEDTVTH